MNSMPLRRLRPGTSLVAALVLLSSFFILIPFVAEGQILTPVSGEMNRRMEYSIAKTSPSSFTIVKPYVQNDSVFPGHYQSQHGTGHHWPRRKLLHESLVEVDSSQYYLFLDPAFDLAMGSDNTGKRTFTNTRGFIAGGRLGKNFAFGTSFYENQAIFPTWIHNGINKRVIPGQGLGRVNGQTWDYAHSSGYISFFPVKNMNIQLGQGKNFIGDGYRSLLLSDAAYNYPYGRISFTTQKWMYSWMLGMTQDISIPKGNDQYAYPKRIISSHLLSVNTFRWLQLSIIKNTVFNNPDTTGRFSPRMAEFNPVLLPVDAKNSHSVWGLNIRAAITPSLWFYAQVACDNLTGPGTTKTAWQGGAKYFDALGVNGLFLQGEFNLVQPQTYSWDNKTLLWLHFGEPLAHPGGNNFSEGIFRLVYTWRRWQLNSITTVTRQLHRQGTDTSYAGFPAIGNNTDIFHNYTQLNWYLNPKTTSHFSLGFAARHQNLSGAANKYSCISFAFRTALFNNYLESP